MATIGTRDSELEPWSKAKLIGCTCRQEFSDGPDSDADFISLSIPDLCGKESILPTVEYNYPRFANNFAIYSYNKTAGNQTTT
jgi:hypothetical protein